MRGEMSEELRAMIEMGYSYTASLKIGKDGERYKDYEVFFNDESIMSFRTDIGIESDMLSVLRECVSKRRNDKIDGILKR